MADFSYKQTPAFSQVMDLVANKRLKEQQIRESQQNVQKSQVDMIRGVAADASSMVSGMVTAAREKQKQSALKDLSGMFATADKPSPGVLPEGVAGPQPRYMTPRQDPAFNDRARSLLIKANPNEATEQMARSLFPVAPGSSGGTPPRSFESYLIGEVNAGRMTKEQAAEELARFKPSLNILGTDTQGNVQTINTHAPTPVVSSVSAKGPIFDKTVKDLSTTEATIIAGAQQNLSSINSVKESLFPDGKTLDRELVFQMRLPGGGMPFTKGRELYAKMIEAISTIQYMESGKAVTETEAAKLVDRYVPKNRDSDATAMNKINRLFERQENALNIVDPKKTYRSRIKAGSQNQNVENGIPVYDSEKEKRYQKWKATQQ